MQLPVEASKITGSSELVTVWDSAALRRQRANPHLPTLSRVIDELGRGSKAAQGLKNVLTSVEKLMDNPGHRLYLLMRDKSAIGILKVGVKKLFIRTKSADLKEIDPLCVLDFYVCETEQRSGYGRVLYDTMLAVEGVMPHQLGYDRPSPKFLSFLRKHFNLSDYVPQTNNFVVFEAYFSGNAQQQHYPASRNPNGIQYRASSTEQQQQQAVPQQQQRAAVGPVSYLPQDHAVPQPSQTVPPAPIPLNTANNRLPALKSHTVAVANTAAAQPQATTLPASQNTRPNALLVQTQLPSRQTQSSSTMSSALAATLPSKSTQQQQMSATAAAPRRDLSPATRSSMGYNIITLEGADALSKSCTPVRQSSGPRR